MIRSACLLLAFAGLSVAAPAPAPDKLAAPKSAPPQFQWVHSVDKDKETIQVGVTRMSPVAVERIETVVENINGQPAKVTRRVVVTEYRTVSEMRQVSVKGATASNGAGKKLTKEELWNELKGNRIILLTHEGEELDPAYRSLLTKEALILHMPKPEPGTVTPPLPGVQPMVEGVPVPLPPIDKP